jgi:hypothetical protein
MTVSAIEKTKLGLELQILFDNKAVRMRMSAAYL